MRQRYHLGCDGAVHRSLSSGGSILLIALFLPCLANAQEQAPPQGGPPSQQDAPDQGEAKSTDTEVVITDKARSHFQAGVNLLADPDGARYEEAYGQFKAAYAESPSWKILNNFGITALKLEKDGEAIDAFQGYLQGGGDQLSPDERAQTERDLQTLQASVVTLTIQGAPQGFSLVDQRHTNRGGSIINHYKVVDGKITLRVRPGEHKISARLAGYDTETWELSATAASSHSHSFALHKPAPAKVGTAAHPQDSQEMHRPVPTSVWIGAGITGAFTAGAVGVGMMALSKNSEYKDANAIGDPDTDLLYDDVKTMNLITDVLIGGAVVSGVVTSILYFTRAEIPLKTAFRFDPVVGPNIAALQLSGNF